MPWRVAQLTTEVHWAAVSEPGYNPSSCGHFSAGGNRMILLPYMSYMLGAPWRTTDAGGVGTPSLWASDGGNERSVTDRAQAPVEIPRCLIPTSGG